MNAQEHHPNDKLQKSSIIFMQLGLILAMLFVYATLEIQVEQKDPPIFSSSETIDDPYPYPEAPRIIKIKRPKKITEVIKFKQKVTSPNIFKKIKNNEPLTKTIFKPEDPISDDNVEGLINDLPDITDDEDIEPESFVLVESVPRFPGCEDLSNEEAKACFTKKITRFVSRKFNTDIASETGLQGKQRIHVQFVIDKNGNVTDIHVQAPHKALEKETRKMIEKLPQMVPGMQRKRPVPVKYTLPIRFEVY